MSTTASIPPGRRSLRASRRIFFRPRSGTSWRTYMMVTRSKDSFGKGVFSALASRNSVFVVVVVTGSSIQSLSRCFVGHRWVSASFVIPFCSKSLVRAMAIISGEVSTPTIVTLISFSCRNAEAMANVDIPTPHPRSRTLTSPSFWTLEGLDCRTRSMSCLATVSRTLVPLYARKSIIFVEIGAIAAWRPPRIPVFPRAWMSSWNQYSSLPSSSFIRLSGTDGLLFDCFFSPRFGATSVVLFC
mmetsp:Transcript_20156/g.50158  ORF Transcript_20156/g.50158 Transcript_20156/m.50158 type:complete len:243 (-) Transcript_20156:116-844(-)